MWLCAAAYFAAVGIANSYKVVCYYTNWSTYRQGGAKYNPSDIDPNLCTHVIYSFAILDATTYTMRAHDSYLDETRGFYKEVVGLKQRNPSLKVLLALGGWADSQTGKYSTMVSTRDRRSKFITAAIQYLQKYGFDGLDLDWEYPGTGDKANFATFVKETKEAFQPLGLLLTAAVSGAQWKIDEAYDVPSLGKYLDQIHIMAYDLRASWDGVTGHHAALYAPTSGDTLTDDAAVQHWQSRGAPASKLILGMPMYGRSWTLANPSQTSLGSPSVGAGQAGQYTGEGGILAYYEICSKSWTKIVTDPSGKIGPYAYQSNQWVSYDDPDILKKKCQYVKQKGLGGAMIWCLDQDDFNGSFCNKGRYPLLSSIKAALA